MARAQEAYATFIKDLQSVWNEEPVRAQIAGRCLAFAQKVREAPPGDEAFPVMESAYRDYVEQLRDAWMQSDLQQRIEDRYLQVTETIQRANEESQQKLDAARRAYVEKLSSIWMGVAPAELDADTLGRVSRNMMVTVFFTEGMRPPEAALPESALFT